MDDTQLCERYVAVWNEADVDARRAAIRAVWREDGRHLLQAPVDVRERAAQIGFPAATLEVRGHRALETRVTRSHSEFAEYTFQLRGAPTRVGEAIKLDWEMIDRAGTVSATGMELLVLDPEDRIAADYQFIA